MTPVHLLGGGRVIAGGAPESVLTPGIVRDAYRADVLVIPHPDTGTPHLIPRRTRSTQAPLQGPAQPPGPPAGTGQ